MVIAGPFAGRILADLGAEVIEVEAPGRGDPLREWKHLHAGTSLWWRVQSRNKKVVTADLRRPEGQALVRALVETSDVLLENFRPGTLERWGLDPAVLRAARPALVVVRVSGFGQTSPYRGRTGLGAVAEAMGGIRYTTGQPGAPPSRTGVSLADEVAALFAVIGALAGLIRRGLVSRGRRRAIPTRPPMTLMLPRTVTIIAVGLRDGLQNEAVAVDTAGKLRLARALIDAGVREMAVTRFVRPDRVPRCRRRSWPRISMTPGAWAWRTCGPR